MSLDDERLKVKVLHKTGNYHVNAIVSVHGTVKSL